MRWPIREGSDRAAICFGAVTTIGLCCIGCDLALAGIVGAMMAALIDIPFSSITHARLTSLKVLALAEPVNGTRDQAAKDLLGNKTLRMSDSETGWTILPQELSTTRLDLPTFPLGLYSRLVLD